MGGSGQELPSTQLLSRTPSITRSYLYTWLKPVAAPAAATAGGAGGGAGTDGDGAAAAAPSASSAATPATAPWAVAAAAAGGLVAGDGMREGGAGEMAIRRGTAVWMRTHRIIGEERAVRCRWRSSKARGVEVASTVLVLVVHRVL